MNKVILVGRLANKPYQGFTGSNVEYSRFTIVTRRTYSGANNESISDFIPCVTWRQNAEFVNKYFDKGSLLLAEGTVQSSRITAKDGTISTSISINVDRVEALESKATSEERRRSNTQEFTIPSTEIESPSQSQAFEESSSSTPENDDFNDLDW